VRRITIPSPGQLVAVRRRRYVVADVKQGLLAEPLHRPGSLNRPDSAQHLVALSSVEDDALGEELQVIWEIEPGATIIEKEALPDPNDGFDPPERLDTFLNAVRWGAASSANTKELQAPFRSGIDIEDYQLDPVVRALQMPRVNLLIADDVGLGKTIEAGLVCQELIIRHRARKILIVCPAALQVQWRDQMRDKFGLEFRIVDSDLLKTLRRERGLHVNPWTHFPRLITSIDFLKRDRPLRLFSEALPPHGESVYPRRFDLLIVDEAHNVAPSGKGRYATDSQRTTALRRIALHFEHKLFLSATPHNGYTESFTALLELLDNQRFARGISIERQGMREQLRAVMVRRLKSELKEWHMGPQFPKRDLKAIEVTYSEREREVHRHLRAYTRSRLAHTGDETEQFASEFVLKLLKKRLFSSPSAFAITLQQHEESLSQAQRPDRNTFKPSKGLLQRQVEQLDEESDNDLSLEDSTETAIKTATPLFRPPNAQERDLLDKMHTWAEDAAKRPDSKAQELINWLHLHIKPGGEWSDERVIIFTEYRATQKWLLDLLSSEGFTTQGRLLTLFGGMDSKEREQIKAAFQADPRVSAVRILVATDAASEGIDLQNHCSNLIHYEIPWNPNRLEQRNGRIDRHGQKAPVVNIYHFVSSTYHHRSDLEVLPTGELDGDLEFLWRALKKVDHIRQDLGKVGPVIASQVEEAMFGKRGRLDTRAAELKHDPLRDLMRFERKLRDQVADLHERLQTSRRVLGLTPQNIQAVVEAALEIAGKPQLRKAILPAQNGKPSIEVFYVPHLNGSWAACKEGLLHPFTREERPIVFDYDMAAGRDDVVLAHLNHRLVSMSLRLLRAAVWSPDVQRHLHRVTARVVSNIELTRPVVIIHARLMLLGSDSQRLHEELIYAGGSLRGEHFERISLSETQRLLNAAQPELVSEQTQRYLRTLWPGHRTQLLHALEARMRDRVNSLQKSLDESKQKEIHTITTILQELRNSILAELKQPEVQQLELFTPEEKLQFEYNKQALIERAEQIESEIREETARIEQHFANPQPRLFPVAITYLVPERLAHM
jgi:superfamily II DNA or RNA helicase